GGGRSGEDKRLERLTRRCVGFADEGPDHEIAATEVRPACYLAAVDPAELLLAEVCDRVGCVDDDSRSAEADRDAGHALHFNSGQGAADEADVDGIREHE